MRAILYARVSSDEQAEGYSLEAQLEAMRGYVDSRGWVIAGEYIEPGFTARTDKRPVFQEVMEVCRTGRADVLVTHKLDRAFRSLIDQLHGLMKLEKWGVSYASVSEQIDVTTPAGKMFLSMLGAFNQYFSDNLATEVRKGKRQRAKKGLSNASRCAYGYERGEDGVDIIVPEQAEVLKIMYEMYSTGVYSYKALAEYLNEEGYPAGAWSTNGKWSLRAVEIALKNPYYRGKVVHMGVEYDGKHEPIISKTLWEKVQATLKRRGKHFSRRAKKPYMLQSLLKCDYCGRTMWCASPRGGPSYYKDPASDYGVVCPGPSYMRADQVDPQVEAIIRQTKLPDDWRQRVVELQERGEPSKREPLLEKLRRIKELYIEGDLGRGEYQRRKAETEQELASMEAPSKARVQQAGVMLESLGDIWDAATTAEKNEMLRAIFIEIGIKDGKVTWFKTDTAFTPLFRAVRGWEEDVEKGRFTHVEEAEF